MSSIDQIMDCIKESQKKLRDFDSRGVQGGAVFYPSQITQKVVEALGRQLDEHEEEILRLAMFSEISNAALLYRNNLLEKCKMHMDDLRRFVR